MARIAYVPVADKDGFTLGIAEEGTKGFAQTYYPMVPTYKEAWEWADSCNADVGITHNDAVEIMLSTMRR